jgi:hypothetical protein
MMLAQILNIVDNNNMAVIYKRMTMSNFTEHLLCIGH